MKKISYLLLVFQILFISCMDNDIEPINPFISDDQSEVATNSGKAEKVRVCHNNSKDVGNIVEIEVSENSLETHLAHGDIQLIDEDGDGWVTHINNCVDGGDCDDTDASVNPGAEEIVYNGKDDDCNPETLDDDLDGDGFIAADDCDDNNPEINTGTEEICDNGIDDNCDGSIDEGCGNIIYIDDVSLENIYHHQEVYNEPTTIVYRNLTSLSGYIYLNKNVNIAEVRVPLLESVGRYIYMDQNENFIDIQIPNLETIGESIYVHGNTSLSKFEFPLLKNTLGGNFTFFGNPLVQELDFPLLTEIQGGLTIGGDNISLINFSELISIGLANDGRTYHFIISGNPKLETFNFNKLNETYGYFIFSGNTNITSLNLPSLVNVGGNRIEQDYIRISNNNNLNEVLIPELQTEIENLNISKNSALSKVVLTKLPRTTEQVYFHQNTNLETIDLSSIQSVGSYLYFHQNLNIQSISLPSLISTGDYAYFNGNTSLTDLNLSSLTKVGNPNTENAYLYITGNTALSNLNANSLNEIYGYLYVAGNASLDMSNTICNLSNIYTIDDYECRDAYAYINGNAVDTVCYTATIHICN